MSNQKRLEDAYDSWASKFETHLEKQITDCETKQRTWIAKGIDITIANPKRVRLHLKGLIEELCKNRSDYKQQLNQAACELGEQIGKLALQEEQELLADSQDQTVPTTFRKEPTRGFYY